MKRTGLLLLCGALICAGLAACSPVQTLNSVVPVADLTIETLRYGPDARQELDLYAVPGLKAAPTVLFIHGGSWTHGDKSEYRFVGESLARAGYVVGVMNYRLAPQHRYPAYVEDAAQALAVLRTAAPRFGGDPDQLFVAGHSAGGFNAVALVDRHGYLEAAGVPPQSVRGVIGIAGPYSYDYRGFPSRNAFAEGSDPADVMPDRFVRPGAPPHLLLVAADDEVVHPQNALQMEAALRAAGVPVERHVLPGLNHITVAAALARPLAWLGGTRDAVVEFIEARRSQ
ncbi:alpha/beta hydrolase [Deinococcus lacus]|uniref:Alpha/beta hydrolase n=1 Tax=Deinococcus lacus TaxID=392561 RepID=A0ABW1Y9F1_9DEIO